MNAQNDNTASARTGMRRIFPPWEYRHLRAWAGARIAVGTGLAFLGVVTLVEGFLFNGGDRVGSGQAGVCRAGIRGWLLGADYRPLRISPDLSLLCSHWSGGCQAAGSNPATPTKFPQVEARFRDAGTGLLDRLTVN